MARFVSLLACARGWDTERDRGRRKGRCARGGRGEREGGRCVCVRERESERERGLLKACTRALQP